MAERKLWMMGEKGKSGNLYKENTRRVLFVFLTMILMPFVPIHVHAEEHTNPANPVHHCTKENDGSDYTDWSYVYFGSYPQSEVTDVETIAAIEAKIAVSDPDDICGDAGVDVWVDGIKYRRISRSDTTSTSNNKFLT